MSFYRRRLPHWQPDGRVYFLTFRLAGTLPHGRAFPRKSLTSGKAFVAMDRLLDEARFGPRHLARAEVATIVENGIRRGELLNSYELDAYVIMPNHVHLLVKPFTPIADLMRMLKSATAVAANRVLGTQGQAFWQDEYFDRWVRDRDEFGRIRRYIENNPLIAGLCNRPEEFRWSSIQGQAECSQAIGSYSSTR